MKKSSLLLSFLLFACSCSKVKELDQRTKSMERSTEQVSSTTEEMKNTTTSMFQQMRSKEAEDTRDEKFLFLMESDAEFGAKSSAAAVFFKSFEFQLWTASGQDNKEYLNELYVDAANEFTRKMVDLYGQIDVSKISPIKKKKEVKSFYAIALAMHMNHVYQDVVMKNKNEEVISMYDLIKQALRKDANGKKLKAHEEILVAGINKEIMIELIKARVDIFSALAVKNLTDERDMTLSQKAKGLLFKITGGKFGDIELPETYDKSNEATKALVEKYLEAAAKAKGFLEEIGQKKELEKTMKSALQNVDFNESETEKNLQDNHKNRIKNFIDTLLN